MAFGVRGVTLLDLTSTAGGQQTIAVSLPPNTAAGDVLLLGAASYYNRAITFPYPESDNWALLDKNYERSDNTANDSGYMSGWCYMKVATADDITAGVINVVVSYLYTGANDAPVALVALSGAGATARLAGESHLDDSYYSYNNVQTVYPLDLTASAGESLVYLLFAKGGGSSTYAQTPPTLDRGTLSGSLTGPDTTSPSAAAVYFETLSADLANGVGNLTAPADRLGCYGVAVVVSPPRVDGIRSVIDVRQNLGFGGTDMGSDLVVEDAELDRAPTTVVVSIVNAVENATMSFYIDGAHVYDSETDSDGSLGPLSIPVSDSFVAGTHTISATQAGHPTSSATFTLDRNPPLYPITRGEDAQAVDVSGAVTPQGTRKWILQDLMPGGLGSYVLPVSPAQMDNPEFERQLSAQHTTAVDGAYHVFEAGAAPLEWTFGGYCPTQEMHDKLKAFGGLNRRFYVIDHRGRAFKVAFANVEMTPRLRQLNIYGDLTDSVFDYTVNALVYDQDWVTPA